MRTDVDYLGASPAVGLAKGWKVREPSLRQQNETKRAFRAAPQDEGYFVG